ncbi:hypothetical protein [Raoultibacter phocaeensis]|uniref:hypothetical protein n=1 Tax=Raoultibacter phocaeensis TaxID=2479841 RepID=UPI00111AD291|nr:hypothetical protein [Raoultibacter phocaeensis]
MSLYWPEANLALDIIDDPGRSPFDREAHPDATVLSVTCAQIRDPEALDELSRVIACHLGADLPPETPTFRAKRRALHRSLFGDASR